MWLGIDVGGTFTDAVLIDQGQLKAYTKVPTRPDHLLEGILEAVDQLQLREQTLERVALSTTVVTNAIVQGKIAEAALVLLAGPGMDLTDKLPVKPFLAQGYVDHRGKEVQKPSKEEFLEWLNQQKDQQIFAIAGKFSVRNSTGEKQIAKWLEEHQQPKWVTLSSEVSGSLNFVRRACTAYYNGAVWPIFKSFAENVRQALKERGITAHVHILKADGGTLPLELAERYPVEAIFTGPAATVLGVMALQTELSEAISLDIGGTTTDIALWQEGLPLFASKGAQIEGFGTSVRAFRLHSVGIGGDSWVRREGAEIRVGPVRKGPAMATEGTEPALADALIVLGLFDFGDQKKAEEAMAKVALPHQSISETAEEVLEEAVRIIVEGIQYAQNLQASEPVYRVEDLVNPTIFTPQKVIGVGGTAPGLVPAVAKKLDLPCEIPEAGEVANAVGAALSRPTLSLTLRADTQQGRYSIPELLEEKPLPSRRFSLNDAVELAKQKLSDWAESSGMDIPEYDVVQQEEFNLVRGFHTVGKVISVKLQIKPGVICHLNQKEDL